MIKQYIDYLKDNPEGLWFKRKLYGWGWTPAKWQGWAVIIIFIALILGNFYRIDEGILSESEVMARFIPQTAILIGILIIICIKKGEKPRWQWGLKDVDK